MQNLHMVDTIDGWTREESYDCGVDHSSPFYSEATDSELVAFKLQTGAALPRRATPGSVGYDLYVHKTTRLPLNRVVMVGTGVHVQSPVPMLVIPRSSISKRGIILANSIGLIDPDYRGEIKLPLVYQGYERQEAKYSEILEAGVSVAQLVFFGAFTPTPFAALSLDETIRGERGFGSTD